MSVSREAWVHILSSKKLMWHGTSSKNLRSILKEGLKANPPETIYGEERGESGLSLETFGGVYFTGNIETAKDFAEASANIHSTNILLVAAQIETVSPQMSVDEDMITDHLVSALGLTRDFSSVLKLWGQYFDEDGPKSLKEVEDWIREWPWDEEIQTTLRTISNTLQGKTRKGFMQLLENSPNILPAVRHTLQSLALYYSVNYWDSVISQVKGSQRSRESFEAYRDSVNVLTKMSKRLADHFNHIRSFLDIGYSGANRIVLVAEVILAPNEASKLKIHYDKSQEAAMTLLKHSHGWAYSE